MPISVEIAKARVEQIKPFADLALTCMSVAAIVIGAWWTYHNFIAEDTHDISPNISVSAEVQEYDDKRALLIVHVKPKNSGKVPVNLEGGDKGDIDVRVVALPARLANGRIDVDKLLPVASAKNIVKRFKGYVIEPGAEYDEVEAFVMPRRTTYFLTAEMSHYDQNSADEVDGSCVVKVN